MKKSVASLFFVFLVATAATVLPAQSQPPSPDQIVRRYLEEVWSAGKLEVAFKLVAPEYQFHNPMIRLIGPTGPDLASSLVEDRRGAFPDLTVEPLDVFADGEKVAVRWRAKGTHSGKLGNVEATGKEISYEGISIFRVAGGHIYEEWTVDDFGRVLRQLGVTRMEVRR